MNNYTNNTKSNYKNIVAGLTLAGALALSGCGRDKHSYDPTPRDDTTQSARAAPQAKGVETLEATLNDYEAERVTVKSGILFSRVGAIEHFWLETKDGKRHVTRTCAELPLVDYSKGETDYVRGEKLRVTVKDKEAINVERIKD